MRSSLPAAPARSPPSSCEILTDSHHTYKFHPRGADKVNIPSAQVNVDAAKAGLTQAINTSAQKRKIFFMIDIKIIKDIFQEYDYIKEFLV